MASSTPLVDTDLVDCAKANANQGVETAAHLCGYGNNIARFQQELQKACDRMGVGFHELSDLITPQESVMKKGGVEFAPDSPSEL